MLRKFENPRYEDVFVDDNYVMAVTRFTYDTSIIHLMDGLNINVNGVPATVVEKLTAREEQPALASADSALNTNPVPLSVTNDDDIPF